LLYSAKELIETISFLVFGLSMCFLYASSSIYHLFGHSPEDVDVFRKIDHAMIYILIAGTYTPLCLIALGGSLGMISFISIWTLALAGTSTVFFKSFWDKTPRWFATFLYVLMGCLSFIIIYPLYKTTGLGVVIWLLIGGLFYIVGAVIYAIKKPNISKAFGFHELFHILVLLGTMSHFWCIYNYLV
jgi:hemolysin III